MITHSELIENWQRMDAASRQANTEAWLAELATWKQRAEAAEAKLARVDEYGVFCWNNAMAAERDGYCDDDLTFEQWLAKRREAQP